MHQLIKRTETILGQKIIGIRMIHGSKILDFLQQIFLVGLRRC